MAITQNEYNKEIKRFINNPSYGDYYKKIERLTEEYVKQIIYSHWERRNTIIDNIYIVAEKLCASFEQLRKLDDEIFQEVVEKIKISDGKIDYDVEDFFPIQNDFLFEDYRGDILFRVSELVDDYEEYKKKELNVKSKN